MMHKAWSGIEEVPYCFSRSYVKLQGHTAKKIVDFDPAWAFPGCNSSLNSPMAMKCCTKLESKEEMPYCFPRSSIKFQGHTGQNITNFDPNCAFPDYSLVATFKSLRFVLFFKVIHQISRSRRTKKSPILTRLERFRTVTQVWLPQWLWNDAQSLV